MSMVMTEPQTALDCPWSRAWIATHVAGILGMLSLMSIGEDVFTFLAYLSDILDLWTRLVHPPLAALLAQIMPPTIQLSARCLDGTVVALITLGCVVRACLFDTDARRLFRLPLGLAPLVLSLMAVWLYTDPYALGFLAWESGLFDVFAMAPRTWETLATILLLFIAAILLFAVWAAVLIHFLLRQNRPMVLLLAAPYLYAFMVSLILYGYLLAAGLAETVT